MQTAQQQIISYLSDLSHGIIHLTEQHASAIISMAGNERTATAIMYRYSTHLKRYEMLRTMPTTDEKIDGLYKILFIRGEGTAYKYECLKCDGEKVTIFSNQNSLFD